MPTHPQKACDGKNEASGEEKLFSRAKMTELYTLFHANQCRYEEHVSILCLRTLFFSPLRHWAVQITLREECWWPEILGVDRPTAALDRPSDNVKEESPCSYRHRTGSVSRYFLV